MKKPILVKHVLPFLQWYALMIALAIVFDYFLHKFNLVFIGRYLGIIGTLTIIISFIYSLRKRKIIQMGKPKQLLQWHEYISWIGSILLLVHAGIHFNAILPWLAVLMLLVAVASGLIGKFLLKRATDTLVEKKQFFASEGMNEEDIERKLFFDSITVDLMKKWRVVHLPITMLLGLLSLLHIITIIMYSK